MAQVMVDKVFSFAELGFQEYETAKYITEELTGNKLEDKKARLLDKTIALRDAIEAAKITEGDVNSMTIGDLITNYLV